MKFSEDGRAVLTLDELVEAFHVTREYQGDDFASYGVTGIVLNRFTAEPKILDQLRALSAELDLDPDADDLEVLGRGLLEALGRRRRRKS